MAQKNKQNIPIVILSRRDSKLVREVLRVCGEENVDIFNHNVPISTFLKKYEGKEVFLIASANNSYNIKINRGTSPQHYISIIEDLKYCQGAKE